MSASVDHDSPAKRAADRHYAHVKATNVSRAKWVGDLYQLAQLLGEAIVAEMGWDDSPEQVKAIRALDDLLDMRDQLIDP